HRACDAVLGPCRARAARDVRQETACPRPGSGASAQKGQRPRMRMNVTLLRESFDLVLEREPNLTHRFYNHLFSRYPQARSMFHPSRRAAQEKMLTDALASVIDHLEDAPWLVEKLGALGTKHVEYGVTPE